MNIDNATTVRSNAWAHIEQPNGMFCVLNNVWGLSNEEFPVTTHSIWYDEATSAVGWVADIPANLFDPSKVRSYQQIYHGQKDVNLPRTSHPTLGKKLSDYSSVVTQFGIRITASDPVPPQANVAAEIFLHAGEEPIISPDDSLDTRRFELMVWTQQPSADISLGVPAMEINGAMVYIRRDGRFPYVAVVLQEERETFSIDWLALINSLRLRFPDVDFDNLRLHSIEAGTEVWGGKISAEVLQFDNTVLVRDDISDDNNTGNDTGDNTGDNLGLMPGVGDGMTRPHGKKLTRLDRLIGIHRSVVSARTQMQMNMSYVITALHDEDEPELNVELSAMYAGWKAYSNKMSVENTLESIIEKEIQNGIGRDSTTT